MHRWYLVCRRFDDWLPGCKQNYCHMALLVMGPPPRQSDKTAQVIQKISAKQKTSLKAAHGAECVVWKAMKQAQHNAVCMGSRVGQPSHHTCRYLFGRYRQFTMGMNLPSSKAIGPVSGSLACISLLACKSLNKHDDYKRVTFLPVGWL
nr:hypothetical protein CFP56_04229 [Quercus suber]